MRAPIGIKRAKQTVLGDRLGKPQKARLRAFLLDQNRRIELAGGVVERGDQIEIAP